MTTEPAGGGRRPRVVPAAVAALLLSCAGMSSARHGDRVDVSSYPPEIQQAYEVFAYRCSRCHTLARPLNAHITDPDHWRRYVTRMRRNPGSGINASNGDVILRFLLFYTAQEQEAAQPEAPAPAPAPAPGPGPGQPKAPAPVRVPDPAPAAPTPAPPEPRSPPAVPTRPPSVDEAPEPGPQDEPTTDHGARPNATDTPEPPDNAADAARTEETNP